MCQYFSLLLERESIDTVFYGAKTKEGKRERV